MEVVVTLTGRQRELLRAAGERETPTASVEQLLARAPVDLPAHAVSQIAGQPALGADATIAGQGQAACVRLRRGSRLRIAQVLGGQCADVLVWGAERPGERFSASLTRARTGASPGHGDVLWSGWPHERPLLELVADSAPGHDLLHPACTPGEYAAVGVIGEPSCAAVQALGAAALGLADGDLHDPLNLWFRPSLEADGRLGWQPTPTGPEDHVELLALVDVLVVVNPCVDDVFGCSAIPGGALAVSVVGNEAVTLVGERVEVTTVALTVPAEVAALLAALPGEAARARALRRSAVEHALGAGGPPERAR